MLAAQVSHFVGYDVAISGSRYLILSLACFSLIFVIAWHVRSLSLSVGFFLLFFYCVYTLFHFIGSVEAFLIIEGLRHELVFVLLSFLIFTFGLSVKNIEFLPRLSFIVCAIVVNGVVAALFAVWQFFDLNILEVLYRRPLDEIGNLTLAIGYRLTSTMVNPINFGAFMVLVFSVINFCCEKQKVNLFVYCLAGALLSVLVVGSLSRLAVIALLFLIVFLHIHKVSFLSLFGFAFVLSVLCFGFFVLYVDGLGFAPILSRFENLFVLSTYTENERVANWVAAINSMQPYEFIWGRGIGASSPDSSVFAVTSARPIENSYITIYYQYGFIGLLLFLALLIRFFYIGAAIGKVDKALGRLVISCALFFFIMHFGNDFVRNLPFSFYYWFLYVFFELTYSRMFLWVR